jgi:hypothetical protein
MGELEMNTAAAGLPRHLYCFVDGGMVRKRKRTFERAVWFGLTCVPGRAWGCTVLLECGAIYRSLPPHALAFRPDPAPRWTLQDAQRWDCYGWHFAALEYAYLSGLRLKARANGREHAGEYLFTAVPVGDGFSLEPEQQKEFTFCKLDNGRLTIQPTNATLFEERSFTAGGWPTDLVRQREAYSCEC